MHKKLIALYLGLFYFLPTALHFIMGQHSNFVDFSIGVNYFLWYVFLILGWWLYRSSIGRIDFSNTIVVFDVFKYQLLWFFLAAISLPLAVYFKLNFGLTFRQEGDGLSEVGGVAKLVFLMKPVLTAYVFYSLFAAPRWRVTDFLVLLFFVLSISGSFEALLIFILFVKVFLNSAFGSMFTDKERSSLVSSALDFLSKVILGVLAVCSIIFIGIANKVGLSESFEYFSSTSVVSKLGQYLYYRVAVFNSTLAIRLVDIWDVDYFIRSYQVITDSFTYRISILSGESPVRPEVTNLNRLNYLEIHRYPKIKEIGASPGLFASFLQLFPAPFAALLCGVYGGFFMSLFKAIRPVGISGQSYSWVAALFALYMMFPFLHNPIMNVTTIGPEFVKFILYLYTFVVVSVLCKRGLVVK